MKKYKLLGLLGMCLLLIACSDKTTYNEAELIRKIDSLQYTVDQLSARVQELETITQNWQPPHEITPAVTTATTATEKPAAAKTTKKPAATVKTTKPSSSVTTAPSSASGKETSLIDLGAFDKQVNNFKQMISELSASIAAASPDEDDTIRRDEFYRYQEEIRNLDSQIKSYQSALKQVYDNENIDQEEFVDKERQLSKLNDALIALEDQLEVKYSMNE